MAPARAKVEKVGDEFNFLRRNKLEKDGLWILAGNYIQQMLKAFEGKTVRQLNSDGDKPEVLHEQEKIGLFRSIAGSGI